jgi:hypothetical protein
MTRPQGVGALSTFILAMSLYPDVQRQAQEDIDRITGGSRLPTLADRDQLPYITAILDEVHRWIPVVSLGLSFKVDLHMRASIIGIQCRPTDHRKRTPTAGIISQRARSSYQSYGEEVSQT